MCNEVASSAQGDQVLFRIISAPAAKTPVVNFQARLAATTLALPAVTLQHLLPNVIVQRGLQLKTRLFGPDWVHVQFTDGIDIGDELVLPGQGLGTVSCGEAGGCESDLQELTVRA